MIAYSYGQNKRVYQSFLRQFLGMNIYVLRQSRQLTDLPLLRALVETSCCLTWCQIRSLVNKTPARFITHIGSEQAPLINPPELWIERLTLELVNHLVIGL